MFSLSGKASLGRIKNIVKQPDTVENRAGETPGPLAVPMERFMRMYAG